MAKDHKPKERTETVEVVFYGKGDVISINDQEYIKTCGEHVAYYSHSGGEETFCVLGVGHPKKHRDKYGREDGQYR